MRLILVEIGLGAALLLAAFFSGAVYGGAAMAITALLFFLLFLYPSAVFEIRHLPWKFRAGALILFLWILIQTFWFSANWHQSFEQVLFWLATAAGFILILNLRHAAVTRLLFVISLIGILQAAFSLYQLNRGEGFLLPWISEAPASDTARGTFLYSHQLAGLLELSLGVLLGLWLHAFWNRDAGGILGYGLFFPLMLYALFKTASPMGFLGFLSAMGLGFLLLLGKKRRLTFLFLICLLVLGGLSVWHGRILLAQGIQKFSQSLEAWQGQGLLWSNALDVLHAHGMTGIGLGNFEWVFPQYQSELVGFGEAHAHNDYLELAIELGLPFFVFWGLAFLALISWLLRHYGKLHHENAALVWGGLIGMTAFLIHNAADFNFAVPGLVLFFFFLAAALVRLCLEHDFPFASFKEPVVKKTVKILSKAGICLVVLFLAAASAQKAWAGYWMHQGTQAAAQDRYGEAAGYLARAQLFDRQNPRLAYEYGHAAWKMAVREKNPAWFNIAARQFEKLTGEMPFYGRAWMYAGLSKLYLFGRSATRRTEEKQEALEMINRAFDLEAGSAWMSYMSGLNMLMHAELLTEDELKLAMIRIKRSLEMAPSRFLPSILSFLWAKYGDVEVLRDITPRNYAAYQIVFDFLQKKNLWRYLAKIYPEYFEMENKAYDEHTEEGLALLERGEYGPARREFEAAMAIDPGRGLAKAGFLLARAAMADLPLNYLEILQEILEENGKRLSTILPQLSDMVGLTGDPYLLGLYAYRSRDYASAADWLEKTGNDGGLRRRLLADSYKRIGRPREARAILEPALRDPAPDLRDLLLLKELSAPESVPQIEEKIASAATTSRPAEAWSDSFGTRYQLYRSGTAGIILNLLPGKRMIEVNLKGKPDANGEHGVLIFRLGGEILGTAYVVYEEWYKILLTAETPGGQQWFEAELMNGKSQEKDLQGPTVYLGDVAIQ